MPGRTICVTTQTASLVYPKSSHCLTSYSCFRTQPANDQAVSVMLQASTRTSGHSCCRPDVSTNRLL